MIPAESLAILERLGAAYDETYFFDNHSRLLRGPWFEGLGAMHELAMQMRQVGPLMHQDLRAALVMSMAADVVRDTMEMDWHELCVPEHLEGSSSSYTAAKVHDEIRRDRMNETFRRMR